MEEHLLKTLFSLSDPINSSSKEYKYQSADTILVMQVIDSVVPGGAEKFIREELFGPMDIDFYNWEKGLSGLPKAAAEFELAIRDMLKVGHLVLNDGKWMGEQLIPGNTSNGRPVHWLILGAIPNTDIFGGRKTTRWTAGIMQASRAGSRWAIFNYPS